MTAENLSSLADTTPEPIPEPDDAPDNYVKVPLTAVLNALRAKRTQSVNGRKNAQKRKWPSFVEKFTDEIHEIDAAISLLEAGPKNQAFQIPLREARAWGFGLMANGRWPKL